MIPPESNHEQQTVIALSRGLAILSCFKNNQYLSHKQICQITQLPKATVTRLLNTLIIEDFLLKTSNELYAKGVQLQKLNYEDDPKLLLIKPLLKQFAEKTQASVNLAICQGDVMFYIACYQSNDEISVNFHEGTTVPIEVTALGRAYYARTSEHNRESIRYYLKKRLGEHYTDAEIMLNNSDAFYAEHGHAFSNGDFSEDILAAAFAIEPSDPTVGCFYSLNASVPRKLWKEQKFIDIVIPALKQLSVTIAQILK